MEEETCAEKLNNLCSSPGVIRVIHEGNTRWEGNVVRVRNLCTSLFDEREEKEGRDIL
jgi:hypothetical protein